MLRYLYVLALVLWVGGLVAAGALVAPSVFGVLQAWNATEGRVLAGQVFGEVLLRLTWLSYAMGGVMFVTLTLHRLLGARPLKYGIRVGIMGVMLRVMMVIGLLPDPGGQRDPGAGDRAGVALPDSRSAPRGIRSPARTFEHPVFYHRHWRPGALLVGSPRVARSQISDLRVQIFG